MGQQGSAGSTDRTDEGNIGVRSSRVAHTRVLAAVLEGVALAILAGAILAGSPFPPIGVLLALLGVALVCANRDALFSSELAATAEASVVVCAVVVFHADSPLIGPLLVGLATGWLDSYHWSSRAFVRMTFNSGKVALGAIAAVMALHLTTNGVGSTSTAALAVGAFVAAVVFVIVDAVLLGALVVVRDAAAWRPVARDVARLDALALPLALYGGAAGLVALDVDAWFGVLAVAPAAWVPETFLVPRSLARGAARAPRVTTAVVVAAVVLVTAAIVGPFSVLTAMFIVGAGALAGVELAVDRRSPVPVAMAAALAVVIVAVAPPDAAAGAALFAVSAVAVSWSLVRTRRRGLTVAIVGTVALAAASGVTYRDHGSVALAVTLFVVGALLCALPVARQTVTAIGWVLPLVVIGATSTELRAWFDPLAFASVASLTLVAAVVLIALSGTTPWRGRLTSRLARHAPNVWHHAIWAALAFITAACGTSALASDRAGSTTAGVWMVAAALSAETAAAMALQRVRLWRFGVRRRCAEAVALAMLLAVVGIAVAAKWNVVLTALIVATATVAVFAIGWPTIDLADRVSGRSAGSDTTDPSSRDRTAR